MALAAVCPSGPCPRRTDRTTDGRASQGHGVVGTPVFADTDRSRALAIDDAVGLGRIFDALGSDSAVAALRCTGKHTGMVGREVSPHRRHAVELCAAAPLAGLPFAVRPSQ